MNINKLSKTGMKNISMDEEQFNAENHDEERKHKFKKPKVYYRWLEKNHRGER